MWRVKTLSVCSCVESFSSRSGKRKEHLVRNVTRLKACQGFIFKEKITRFTLKMSRQLVGQDCFQNLTSIIFPN